MRLLHFSCLIFLFSTHFVMGQDDDWMEYDSNKKVDSANQKQIHIADSINFDAPNGTIQIDADPRVNTLIDFVGTPKTPDPVLMKGYRVQISFSQDKNKALEVKTKFRSSHSDIGAYIDYLAPNFRVRVGNFKTRLQAEKLQQDVIDTFPAATIVKDLIELPHLDYCDVDGKSTKKDQPEE